MRLLRSFLKIFERFLLQVVIGKFGNIVMSSEYGSFLCGCFLGLFELEVRSMNKIIKMCKNYV